MHSPNFLIMDSGVGGLSIWQEIRRRLPHSHCCYVADNAAYPYGALAESVLTERLATLLPGLEQSVRPDIVVVACNTASTLVLDRLRTLTSTPIIGVVPAIKPAAAASRSRHIALLATPGTVTRPYIDRLVAEFAVGCRVTRIGSHELVQAAEQKLRGDPVDSGVLARVLAPLRSNDSDMDHLVLGCTHFPLLRDEIRTLLAPEIQIIDSGDAIARRAAQLHAASPPPLRAPQPNRFLFTAEHSTPRQLEPGLHAFGFDRVRFLDTGAPQSGQKSGAS